MEALGDVAGALPLYRRCASMADVFDNKVPAPWRADLWSLIRSTPALDWFGLHQRWISVPPGQPTDGEAPKAVARTKMGQPDTSPVVAEGRHHFDLI
jgi:hypothetical protein